MGETNLLPKVSVMITVYNQLHCLSEALESALAQDYPNLEIVICDDHSTDGHVQQFIENYADERIKYFRNETNLGVAKNFFKILNVYSSGDFAIMLNADDYWTDISFISNAISIFQEDSEVSLVFGDVKVFIEGNHSLYEDLMHKDLSKINDGNKFFMQYADGYSLPHLSCLYNRPLAISLGFYTEKGLSEDWCSMLKIIIDRKIGYIPKSVGVITKHLHNHTKNTNMAQLSSADDYIESVYNFALQYATFAQKELELWRFKMLKRHHIKWLIKIWFLEREKLPYYKSFIKEKHPQIYSSIQRDIRYWGYLSIRWSPKLLRFVFKRIINQESFMADLLVHKNTSK